MTRVIPRLDLDAMEREAVSLDKTAWRVAIHETGHACAAILLGAVFECMTVGDDEGIIVGDDPPGRAGQLLYLSAGYAYERFFCANFVTRERSLTGARGDMAAIRALLRCDPLRCYEFNAALACNHADCRQYRASVILIAHALWKEFRLSYADALELFDQGCDMK